MTPGKRFEVELRKGFRSKFPNAFVHRFIDNYDPTRMVKGHQSPPDLLVIGHRVHLIEAKSVKGISIPFNRLAPHQEQHLAQFHENGHRAYIAVEFRNVPKGKVREVRQGYLISYGYWCYLRENSGRKSLTMEQCEKHASGVVPGARLRWEKGQYIPSLSNV